MERNNFFKKIKSRYGIELVKNMKKLMKFNTKLARAMNKKIFLLRCRKDRIYPKNRKLKNSFNINPLVFKKLESRFIFGVLNQEIAETFLKINKLNRSINLKLDHIKNFISPYFFRRFKQCLENSYKIKFEHIKAVQIRKFNNILSTPVAPDIHQAIDTGENIVNLSNSLEHNNNWLVNISDTEVPDNVSNVLKLGNKFCPPTPSKSVPYIKIIAGVESALINNSDDQLNQPLLRNQLVNILTNFKYQNRQRQILTVGEQNLIKDISVTKSFIKNHPEILVTNADKGNVTVVVNRSDYINKIETMLQDTNVYEVIDRDSTAIIQRKLNDMVTSWVKEGRILESEAKCIKSHHGVLARLYGLPKIHKINTPYRPIVSSIGTALYELSAFVSRILNQTVGKSASSVKNSVEFKEKIKTVFLPQDHIILSLDVISLFTNIDSHLALELVSKRWTEIKRNSKTKLKKTQFIEALSLVLNNCEFSFNGKTYRQLFGSPMGSPTSPAVADLVMEYVETTVLNSLDFKPIFYYRYVDDIVMAIPQHKFNILFEAFNNFNANIKFTAELENNHRLSFLDLLLIHNTDGSLSTDWFHKTTWSGRYLNFNSHLPLSYKKNTVTLLSNKILQLSDPIFHDSNFRLLKTTLVNNGYPNSFINRFINSTRYSGLPTNNHSADVPRVSNDNTPKYISIPYVKTLYEKISFCLKKYNFRVVGKAHNNFGISLFSPLKDRVPVGKNKNVVYKIVCECNKSYIGQTTQLVNTRFIQHKRDTKKLSLNRVTSDLTSALSTHLHETKHDIFLDNVKILEREANNTTRRVLEMLHIKADTNCINKQSDCAYLQSTYNQIIHIN